MIDFFADAGAWFDQAGKDIDQAGQDFGETVQNGARVVGDALHYGAQVIGDVFNPANGPSGDGIADQIESQIPNNSGPSGDGIVDQIESQIGQQSISDYVVGPDFNNPAPELPSPGFKTFDPLTNPNPGLESSAFEFGAVGIDALSIDSTYGADFTTIEDLQGLVAAGGSDSIDSLNESLLNPIFEVAEILTF